MNHDRTKTAIQWRTLKNIAAHYMYNSIDHGGRSGRDIIQQRFKQREMYTRTYEMRPRSEADRLAYESDIQGLDRLIDKTHNRILRLVSEQAKDGKWVAFGRRNLESDHEQIAAKYWPFLDLDLDRNAVKGDGLAFYDLRCCFASDLPPESAAVEKTSAPRGAQAG